MRSVIVRFQPSLPLAACLIAQVAAVALAGASKFDSRNPVQSALQNLGSTYDEASIAALIEQGSASRAERVRAAFANVSGEGLRQAFCPLFANLALGEAIDATNRQLQAILTSDDPSVQQKYRLNDHWCLVINQQLYHMYYAFGSKGTVAPGRLYPETEKALLNILWQRMQLKNDIHLTQKSTWWMVGSENHDIVAKVSSLISSQIFMNEPEYRDRTYPNLGTGGGSTYWFHQMYSEGVGVEGPLGRANYGDGKAYKPADHYRSWVNYFDEFFTERAKRGFFLEMASPGYMQVTLSHLMDIYDLCSDSALAEKAGNFLDLVWVDWAIEQLNGVRGGSKTRVSNGARWVDSMYRFAQFYFGGKGSAQGNDFTLLLSDYELKPIHWHLALDREGLGEFAFVSRRPGEEEGEWPRPLGAERTLLCDTESRFVRYSWITPDYILGCQMDHPGAIHSHLSSANRWQGIIFKGADGPRVFPTDAVKDNDGNQKVTKTEGLLRCVQHETVMLAQQARRWSQMNPDWFPARSMTELPYGIYFSGPLERMVERSGWVFVEHGDAFLAVRSVMGEYADGWRILKDDSSPGLTSSIIEGSYEWSPDRKMMYFKDKYAGMIFEASRREQHDSLEAFISDVLDNPIFLDKTVVPGFHILRYTGCGEDAKEITFNLANNEIPFIDGERVDYAPDMLFDSPFLRSKYKSAIMEISKGPETMTLNFN